MADSTVPLVPRCHCRKYDPILVPSSAFPLYASACHCKLCRQVTGTLCVHFNQLPGGVEIAETTISKLRCYKTSELIRRYFCGTCGAHIAIWNTNPTWKPHYSVATAAIPARLPSGQPTAKQVEHIFVQPEDGGGLARYFDDGLPKWTEDVNSTPASEPQWTTTDSAPAKVPLRCACGDFRAELVRPSELLDAHPVEGHPLERAWKRCVSNDKWRYSVCPCESCRLTTGFPFSTFFFILKSAIQSVPGSKGVAGLTTYASSDDVTRYFCGRCGASVLYEVKDESEIGLHDLFAGVVDGPLAPVLKEWVWRSKLSKLHVDDADDHELTETLRKGWDSSLEDASAK